MEGNSFKPLRTSFALKPARDAACGKSSGVKFVLVRGRPAESASAEHGLPKCSVSSTRLSLDH